MGDVYANSYFTIAAYDAKDDTEGFFKRNWTYTVVDFNSSIEKSARIHLRPDMITAQLCGEPHPLQTRAWTLQEQILSRRVMAFGKLETFWKCETTITSETANEGWIKDVCLNPCDLRSNAVDPATHGDYRGYKRWYQMACQYSSRALTYDKYKLPALGGLASRVASFDHGKYCAGIWWDDVPNGLLWKRLRRDDLKKHTEYTAPSY